MEQPSFPLPSFTEQRGGLHPQATMADEPVPLHFLLAAQSRAQRDRMLLLLLAFFAVAVAATIA